LDDLVRREPQLRVRLESLDRSDAELRERLSPERLAAGIRSRLHGNSTRGARAWHAMYWSVPIALSAVVLLLAINLPRSTDRAASPTPTTAGDDRIKGLHPSLAIYRRTAAGSESLAHRAVARRRDLL